MGLYQTIKILAGARGLSISRIERDLDISNGTIRKWDVSMPRADNLRKVADYLDVTSAYLLNNIKNQK